MKYLIASIFVISVAAIISVTLFSAQTSTDPLEKAKSAFFDHHDYQTALRLLRPLADQGNPEAELMIGRMYEIGAGVNRDQAVANRWYRKVQKAAEQGNAAAQAQMGWMFWQGEGGVMHDEPEATKWFRYSAEQGNIDAMEELGVMYGLCSDCVIKKDYAEAYFWFSIARHGNLRLWDINKAIGNFKSQNEILQHLTPHQKSEVDKRVEEWLKKGHPHN